MIGFDFYVCLRWWNGNWKCFLEGEIVVVYVVVVVVGKIVGKGVWWEVGGGWEV